MHIDPPGAGVERGAPGQQGCAHHLGSASHHAHIPEAALVLSMLAQRGRAQVLVQPGRRRLHHEVDAEVVPPQFSDSVPAVAREEAGCETQQCQRGSGAHHCGARGHHTVVTRQPGGNVHRQHRCRTSLHGGDGLCQGAFGRSVEASAKQRIDQEVLRARRIASL